MEMTGEKVELHCYNRGCGQKFDPADNDKDVCCHHPGLPFFHDAYKGWSCCNKKCTDFTEFLNIKGCTLAKHSNEKPPELPKSKVNKETAKDVVTVSMPAPKTESKLARPSFDSPLVTLTPNVAESLKQKFSDCPHKNTSHYTLDSDSIVIGTACKNGGCRGTYEGPQSDSSLCIYHPGSPVFHEGMKYWSCCQKKTTDFNTFLNQAGCSTGSHVWKKEAHATNTVKCRWDWHQTGTHVVVAVYSKDYHPFKSFVKLNPIRLLVQLEFPNSADATFDLDLELRGVVDIKQSTAHMLGTKVEIKLRKAEPGSWAKLDFPRAGESGPKETKTEEEDKKQPEHVWDDNDDIDLDDVEPISGLNITEVK